MMVDSWSTQWLRFSSLAGIMILCNIINDFLLLGFIIDLLLLLIYYYWFILLLLLLLLCFIIMKLLFVSILFIGGAYY